MRRIRTRPELADFLDEYAGRLDALDHEELVGESAEVVTTRPHSVRLGG